MFRKSFTLENGKYTYIQDIKGQRVLRYGAPWRNVVGDKFIGALVADREELIEALQGLMEEWDKSGGRISNENTQRANKVLERALTTCMTTENEEQ